MNRITIERVREAYKKCGKRPLTGDWYANGSVCPLSALYLEDHTFEELADVVDRSNWDYTREDSTAGKLAKALGLSNSYVSGFYHGVDKDSRYHKEEDYQAGYEDGLKVRRSLFHEVEETPDLVHAEP